jgi:biopolymer transport protein ExbB
MNARRPGRRFALPPTLFAALAVAVVCCVALAQQGAAPAPAPATAPTTQETLAAQTQIQERTLFELFRAGGPFMYALLACSVVSVTIVIERFVSLRRAYVVPAGFMPGLRGVFRDPRDDRQAALEYCRTNDSAIARVVGAGLRRLPQGPAATEKAVEDVGANEAFKLRRNIRMLYALGSIATLLGLIGTISGMIKAFQVAAGGGMGKAELLAKGIYEAMVNTFGGLAVAIVCTAFYYYFLGRIERLIADMNDACAEFGERYVLPAAQTSSSSSAAAAATRTRSVPDEEMEPVGAGK